MVKQTHAVLDDRFDKNSKVMVCYQEWTELNQPIKRKNTVP